MVSKVIVGYIDDCTFELTRDSNTIIVAIKDGLLCIINPSMSVKGVPLIMYGYGGTDAKDFSKLILNIIRGQTLINYFSGDVREHMKHGNIVEDGEPLQYFLVKFAIKLRDDYNNSR